MPNLSKRKQKLNIPLASRKEWISLVVLIFLAVATGSYIFYLVGNSSNKNVNQTDNNEILVPNTEDNNIVEENSKITPLPFEEKEHILKDTTDSKYLTTEGYYYLIHKILGIDITKEEKETNIKLGWEDLVKMSDREKIRGKFMRLRGSLVEDLQKEVIKGVYAEERGFENLVVWRGAISSIDGRLFLFTVTEPLKGVKSGDAVELYGIFFKIWIYENRGGLESKHPYFIGKQITLLPQVEPTQHKKMTVIFLIFFAIICILLGYSIVYERQEANKFWSEYAERKVKRMKKRSQKDPGCGTEGKPSEVESSNGKEDESLRDEEEEKS